MILLAIGSVDGLPTIASRAISPKMNTKLEVFISIGCGGGFGFSERYFHQKYRATIAAAQIPTISGILNSSKSRMAFLLRLHAACLSDGTLAESENTRQYGAVDSRRSTDIMTPYAQQ